MNGAYQLLLSMFQFTEKKIYKRKEIEGLWAPNMEVRIEINIEKNQVKKIISKCQLKAGHNCNRPITSFKHSEKLQYLATRVNKPQLHSKNLITFLFNFSAQLLSSYLGHYYVKAKTLPVFCRALKLFLSHYWQKKFECKWEQGARRVFGPNRKWQKTVEKYTIKIFMIFTFQQTLSLLSDRERQDMCTWDRHE
jgi:hypothetical protein